MFWCLASIGRDSSVSIGHLDSLIRRSCQRAAEEGYYRRSVVSDPIYSRINTGTNLPPCFPVGSRAYVLLTDEARSVLKVVEKYAKADAAARASFVANPRRAILKEIEEEQPELADALGQVFIETPDFLSSRVTAFGPWKPKLCAFVQPVRTEWFGDGQNRYVVVVGGDALVLQDHEIRQLFSAAHRAKAAQEPSFRFMERQIETDEVDLGALESLAREIEAETLGNEEADEGGEASASSRADAPEAERERVRYGPQIEDNLETLGYRSNLTPRPDYEDSVRGIAPQYALMPHQQEAFAWLRDLWVRGVPGGLLADDMGLGKTLQCLAFLKWLQDGQTAQDSPFEKPSLVVAPVGLIQNWAQEAEKYFEGRLPAPLILNRETARRLKRMSVVDRKNEIEAARWVVTNYEMVRDKPELFGPIHWNLMVFDEAQKLKTPTAMATELAKALKQDFVLALTGTPVENNLVDIWSIMDAVAPGALGTLKDFQAEYGGDKDPVESGRRLHRLLTAEDSQYPRLMLRRLKTDRLDNLPRRHVDRRPVPMPPAQRARYEQLRRRRNAPSSSASNRNIALLMDLNRCSLSVERFTDETKLTPEMIKDSARLSAFFEILDEIHDKGEKVVVFVQHLVVQRVIAREIMERYGLQDLPGQINGSMNDRQRQAVVNRFQNSPEGFDALVLQVRSASIGITLTAANHVIHLERWWNPAVEDQASDRVYRIGQKKRDVYVHLPMAILGDGDSVEGDESFDAVLDQFLENKRRISQSVLLPLKGEAAEAELCRRLFDEPNDAEPVPEALSQDSEHEPSSAEFGK